MTALLDTRPAAAVHHLTKAFDDNIVLREVDLTVDAGEFLAIVGHSGCGKSTLLRVLAGIERPTAGSVSTAAPVAVGFQDSRLIPWQRVWQNVVFGLRDDRRELKRRAVAALHEVGLDAFADAWPHTLSGGQAQRVSLARALTLEPRLLLLDEPFGALDALTRLQAQALVSRVWRQHGFAVALVTHDVEEAIVLADRVVIVDEGRIVADIRVDLPRPRSHADHRVTDLKGVVLALLGVDADEDFSPADQHQGANTP
ncbi:ABC transporter ATP-binding protein [Microbacterium sp. NPDC055910]|uniref:ABC transporter ATP-binding protein n=1 Tax=Microbacterium sp. NPDC055910 TaxID=3345659 RepID=UPI0035DAC841